MEVRNLQHMQRSLAVIENIETWQAAIDKQVKALNELLADYTRRINTGGFTDDNCEDKFTVLAEGQITHQQTLNTYFEADALLHDGRNGGALNVTFMGNSNDTVLISYTTGLLDGVPVLRKSYNSADPHKAAKVAKRDMKWLEKYSHPNVARIMGVMRSSNGRIQDIVMSKGQMPYKVFLERTTDPAALVNYRLHKAKGNIGIPALSFLGAQLTPAEQAFIALAKVHDPNLVSFSSILAR
ncbi:hypothetical protein FS749_007701 [Ceratobasidium sp. UAMH 11750]|nr:hypothetical protein FS749_007701 [Ceratobasidium sp. UAMH 11750]